MSITSPLTPATPDGTVARIASGLRRVGAAVAASEAAFRDRPLTASVLVVATLTVPFFAVFTPGYQTNDDAWMAMIAAGQGVSLSPDEHLVYSNVVVGKALRALYTAVPSVPWYGCHLYLAQIAAHIALLYSTLSLGFTRRGLALCAVYFATAGVFLLNNLQFTSTAFLTVQAGAPLLRVGAAAKSQRPWGLNRRTARLWRVDARLGRLDSIRWLLPGAALRRRAGLHRSSRPVDGVRRQARHRRRGSVAGDGRVLRGLQRRILPPRPAMAGIL